MEIVVKTIKLKSTIVKQLQAIKLSEISDSVICLGYIIGVLKDAHKAYILQLPNNEYRILWDGWYSYENSTRIIKKAKGAGTYQKDLQSVENVKTFLSFLDKCKNNSEQIYI